MSNHNTAPPKLRRDQRGMSLIEIMIGLVVAMIASLVVIQAFSVSEGMKRNTTGGSDAMQQAAMISYYLNTKVQNAGSGLTRASKAWGCKINASGTLTYPMTTALAAPFDSVPLTLRVSPILVISGGTDASSNPLSDVLITMSGNSDGPNRWFPVTIAGGNSVVMGSALGVHPSDYLLLVSRSNTSSDPSDCQLTRVATTFTTTFTTPSPNSYGAKVLDPLVSNTVPLDTTAMGSALSTLTNPYVLNQGTQPDWLLFGVDSNGYLQQTNLIAAPTQQNILAENVFLFKVLYGLDTDNDNIIDKWVQPNGAYAYDSLVTGVAADEGNISHILAVRIGLVLRSSQISTVTTAGPLVLFSDLGSTLSYSRTLSTADEQHRQYQTYDWVIPLRNVKLFN